SATNPGGQPDIAGPASANFDYTPFLGLGTDTSPTFGFQGNFSDLHVVASGAQVGVTGRLTEAVGLLTATGTLHIHTGTYSDTLDTTGKAVTVSAGTSPGQVTINGNLSINGDDTVPIELAGPSAATQYDNFVVNGTVSLGGATLSLSRTFTSTPGTV